MVFVAGASGRTGSRVTKELLDAGLAVRAGTRDGQPRAEWGPKAAEAEAVAFDLTAPETLAGALGAAGAVVCCIGAPENEFKPGNPRAIDGEGTVALVEAAKAAGVEHFVLVSSLGTGRFGWPASILNLFFNVLDWKRTAEVALIESGVPYTIVRPGGMERPDDEYYKEHNLVLDEEDSRFGGQVSRLQVAWVCREAVQAPEKSRNKLVEVVAEAGAPATPIGKQLDRIKAGAPGAPEPGTAAAYDAKYAFSESASQRFVSLMAADGALPEVLNGRLAMVGFAAALLAEKAQGVGLVDQLASWTTVGRVVGLLGLVQVASTVPLLKGVQPRHADLGPMKARVEMLHGRLAMLGLAGALAYELREQDKFANLLAVPDLGALGLPAPADLPLAALPAALLATSLVALGPLLAAAAGESQGGEGEEA